MSLQKRPFRYASASERSQRKGQWRPRWEGIQGNVILGEQREEQRLGGGGSHSAGEERILASLSSFCSSFASDRNVEKDASHGGVESSGCEHVHLC